LCISRWLGSKTTCPICRREWEFRAEGDDKKDKADDNENAEDRAETPPPGAAVDADQ